MNILIIGLGSMGKRRIRNLQALKQDAVAGYDPRADRRAEAADKYGVEVYTSVQEAFKRFRPDILVICTGPEQHMEYGRIGVDRGLHCFIEASVVDAQGIRALGSAARDRGLVVVPSCTLRYYPGPRKIKELVGKEVIGKPLNLNYQIGQYLPDWHPWEKIQDFYVSKRETGGCREIVPFELTWLNDIFGNPEPLRCLKSKLTDMDADIDDIYHCILRYPTGMLANITVEVISRPQATREFRLLGSEGIILFSGEQNCVRYLKNGETDWVRYELGSGTIEDGYINPEEPYINEVADFLKAVELKRPDTFPNTLDEDAGVLELLNTLEQLSETRV